MKNIIDERQEIEYLKVYRFAYWTMWIMLLLSNIYHMYFSSEIITSEVIIFVLGNVVLTVGGARIGVWDPKLKPTIKNYVIVGCVAVVIETVLTITSGIQRRPLELAIMGICTFVIAFGISWLSGAYAKRQLEKDTDDEE